MFKKFLRNLFSLRTVNVITRTCICILSVLVTLAVIEIGFFSNEERGYRARLGRFMPETEEENKEDKSLSVDTLQGYSHSNTIGCYLSSREKKLRMENRIPT